MKRPFRFALFAVTLATSLLASDDATSALHQLLNDHWRQAQQEQIFFRVDSDAWRPNGKLAEMNSAARARRASFNESILERLAKIDMSELSPSDQINYRVFKFERETEKASYRYYDHLFPITKLFGYHTYFADAPASMSFRSAADYEKYLISLNDFTRYNREHIQILTEAIELGYTQYGPSLAGYEETIRLHIVEHAEDSALFVPFRSFPSTFSADRQADLKAQGVEAIMTQVVPAYRELYKFFTEVYQPKCRKLPGISSLKGGADYYQYLIQFYTTVNLTPRQIHDTGLAEVDRIRGEMDAIIERVDFNGSFSEFLEFLRSDPRFFAESEQDLLEKVAFITQKMNGTLPRLFGVLPRNTFAIKPTHGRGAFYMSSTGDGTTPGTYFLSTDLASQPLYNLEALSLHEAVPGHHLQSALAMEQDMPEFRKTLYHAAYGEGWGLYSERLGKEFGFYEDPYSDFGRLTYEMWRACRLVVDTGIHAFGWSRQQAIDYLMANTALTQKEVTDEVDRYITWPGQALAYKIGELRIRGLRAKAEKELGDKFDLRAFHDTVVGHGSLPIAVLEDLINGWIERQR